MKYYISSRLSNRDQVRKLSDYLNSKGFSITFDWTRFTIENNNVNEIMPVVKAEIDGISEADAVVVLLPGGIGTHVELGIAIAENKPIILCSEDENKFFDSAFYSYERIIKSNSDFVNIYNLLKTVYIAAQKDSIKN